MTEEWKKFLEEIAEHEREYEKIVITCNKFSPSDYENTLCENCLELEKYHKKII